MEDIPENLLVVGGGYIGMELGTVYATLGSKVAVVEALDAILAGADPDLARPVVDYAKKSFQRSPAQNQSRQNGHGRQTDQSRDGIDGKKKEELYDRVLVSVGRVAELRRTSAWKTPRSRCDEKGFIKVNEQAADDRSRHLRHRRHRGRRVAGAQGVTRKRASRWRVIIGENSAFRRTSSFPPWSSPIPEVAWCGLTEAEAKAKGIAVEVAKFPWAASGRALTFDRTGWPDEADHRSRDRTRSGRRHCRRGRGRIDRRRRAGRRDGRDREDLALTVHPHPTLVRDADGSGGSFLRHCDAHLIRASGRKNNERILTPSPWGEGRGEGVRVLEIYPENSFVESSLTLTLSPRRGNQNISFDVRHSLHGIAGAFKLCLRNST